MKELREKVMHIIAQKSMCSYMNHTKWTALQKAIGTLPFPPPYVLKSVLEDESTAPKFDEDVFYAWGDWSYEGLLFGCFYAIEWIKVRPRYKIRQGRLMPPEMIDESEEFRRLLEEHHIPYEENNGLYTIYGYK